MSALTFNERKALADAAARKLQQQAQKRTDERAIRQWRSSVLSRWMARRVR